MTLNQSSNSSIYSDALQTMQQRIDEVDDTLSAQVIADTLVHNGTWGFGSFMAQQHAEIYAQHQLSEEKLVYFEQLAQQSLKQQQQLEQDSTVSFEDYLTAFR